MFVQSVNLTRQHQLFPSPAFKLSLAATRFVARQWFNKTLKWTQKACGFSVHLAQRYASMIMNKIVLCLLVFPIFAIACEEDTKAPDLRIEEDRLKANAERCGYYVVNVPTEFKGEIVHSIYLKYGEDLDDLKFLLSAGPHHNEDGRTQAIFCANPKWLESASLTITYKHPPRDDGSFSLCATPYDYNELSKHVTPG